MTAAEKFEPVPPSGNAGPDIPGMNTRTHQIEAIERPAGATPHRGVTVVDARAKRPHNVSFTAAAESGPARVDFFDEFGGFGIYASEAIPEIVALDGGEGHEVEFHLSSPGGDVWEAFAIAAAMQFMKARKIVIVYGLAASAATFILAVADEVRAAGHSQIMVHEPAAGVHGNAAKLAEVSAMLGKLKTTVANMYVDGCNGLATLEAVNEWMESGKNTWMTALEAASVGLVDVIIDDQVKVTACAAPADFLGELPEGVAELLAGTPAEPAEEPAEPTDQPVEETSAEEAPAAETEPETPAEPELTTEAAAEIRIACQALGAPDRADEFITARATVDQVREALWNARAQASAQLTIDTRVTPRAEDAAVAAAKAKTTSKVEQAAEIRRRQIAALSPKH